MIDKINILDIVRNHFSTFRSFSSQRSKPADFLLFLLVPLLVAASLVLGGATMPTSAIAIVATALAVFASLFFSLLILVVDLAIRNERPDRQSGRKGRIEGRLIQELHANVAFAILVSVAALISLAGLSLDGGLPGRRLLIGIAFYLCTQFFLTLLMILKRAAALIGNIVSDTQRKAS